MKRLSRLKNRRESESGDEREEIYNFKKVVGQNLLKRCNLNKGLSEKNEFSVWVSGRRTLQGKPLARGRWAGLRVPETVSPAWREWPGEGKLEDAVRDGREGRSRRVLGPPQRLVFPMNDVCSHRRSPALGPTRSDLHFQSIPLAAVPRIDIREGNVASGRPLWGAITVMQVKKDHVLAQTSGNRSSEKWFDSKYILIVEPIGFHGE